MIIYFMHYFIVFSVMVYLSLDIFSTTCSIEIYSYYYLNTSPVYDLTITFLEL